MAKLTELYPKDVRIVFFHNPLHFHKKAMPAAEAGSPASEPAVEEEREWYPRRKGTLKTTTDCSVTPTSFSCGAPTA